MRVSDRSTKRDRKTITVIPRFTSPLPTYVEATACLCFTQWETEFHTKDRYLHRQTLGTLVVTASCNGIAEQQQAVKDEQRKCGSEECKCTHERGTRSQVNGDGEERPKNGE